MNFKDNVYLWIALIAPVVIGWTIYSFREAIKEPDIPPDRKYFPLYYALGSLAPSLIAYTIQKILELFHAAPVSMRTYFPFILVGVLLMYLFVFARVIKRAMPRDTNRLPVHGATLVLMVLVPITLIDAYPALTQSGGNISAAQEAKALDDVHTMFFFYVLFTVIVFFLVYNSKPTFGKGS